MPTRPSLLRYASVGAAATLVHYAVLVALVETRLMPAPLAAAVGAWVGAQVAFVLNVRFTFRPARATIGSWVRFQATAVIGALLSFAMVAVGQRLGVHYLLAQAAATLAGMLVTFEVNRRWSFAPPTPGRA